MCRTERLALAGMTGSPQTTLEVPVAGWVGHYSDRQGAVKIGRAVSAGSGGPTGPEPEHADLPLIYCLHIQPAINDLFMAYTLGIPCFQGLSPIVSPG